VGYYLIQGQGFLCLLRRSNANFAWLCNQEAVSDALALFELHYPHFIHNGLFALTSK
jgi:hypothetical protein